MFKFEKLDVWQKATDFADVVYSKTKSFPSDERFGLTDQMWRPAVSVSSNMAEGSSRILHGRIESARLMQTRRRKSCYAEIVRC
jgi:four helix bundle protein